MYVYVYVNIFIHTHIHRCAPVACTCMCTFIHTYIHATLFDESVALIHIRDIYIHMDACICIHAGIPRAGHCNTL